MTLFTVSRGPIFLNDLSLYAVEVFAVCPSDVGNMQSDIFQVLGKEISWKELV